MESYLGLLREVLQRGEERKDRTGTGTRSLFGRQIDVDLSVGFPLLTTKKVHFKSVAHELLWFLRGEDHIKYLLDHGVSIWNEWANTETGHVGPLYGVQWTRWPNEDGKPINQLAQVIEGIRTNPTSRRLLVSAWNVGALQKMALPPCHVLFQFYVSEKKGLSCQVYQRSADLFLGVPFNIASYALLTHMVAKVCELRPERLLLCFGDVHLYQNHLPQARIQLRRTVRALPHLELNPRIRDLFAFSYEDIKLYDYDPHPSLKADISV